MSHHHDHDHCHDHHHGHDHHHTHAHHDAPPLSLKQQLETLIAHWVGHNEAHKGTYLTWATRAQEGGYAETAALIKEIADMTDAVSEKLKLALEKVHTAP